MASEADTTALLAESRRLRSAIRALAESQHAQAPSRSLALPPTSPATPAPPTLLLSEAFARSSAASPQHASMALPSSAYSLEVDEAPRAEKLNAADLTEREALLRYNEEKVLVERARLDRREAALGEIALRLRSRNERAHEPSSSSSVHFIKDTKEPAALPRTPQALTLQRLSAAAAAAAVKMAHPQRAERLRLSSPPSQGRDGETAPKEGGETRPALLAHLLPPPILSKEPPPLQSEATQAPPPPSIIAEVSRAQADAPKLQMRAKPGRPSPAGSGI